VVNLQPARDGGRGAVPSTRAVIVSIIPSFPPSSTMSLTSTGNIKSQLTAALGDKGPPYFSTFQLYLKASISRQEFEDQVRECLDTPHLRASSCCSSKRDSRAHLDALLHSTTTQLARDISV